MKLCDTCKGLGSVPDPKIKNSTIRCRDCNGTGRATTDNKVEASIATVDSKKEE
jgi:DnaJ-class molecular chaperone